MKARRQIVEIEWEDSASDHGWMSTEEATGGRGTVACRSVGYLVRSDKDVVTVVQNRQNSELHAGVVYRVGEAMSIPKSVIRRIRVLK